MTYEKCQVKKIQFFTTKKGEEYAIMYIDVNGVVKRYFVYGNYRRVYDMLRLLTMGHIKEGDYIAFEAVEREMPIGPSKFARIWKMKKRNYEPKDTKTADAPHTTPAQGTGGHKGD